MTLDYRVLTPKENAVVDYNVRTIDQELFKVTRYCSNPKCGFPLSIKDPHFFVMEIGAVCSLCHTMFFALTGPHLTDPRYFRKAQEAWLKEIEDKKRMTKSGDEGNGPNTKR